MKKFYFTYLFVLITLLMSIIPTFSQDLLNVREVFDFNIGDEFHYSTSTSEYVYPNADRYTIIDKFYSANADTVFYIRQNDGYYCTLSDNSPTHLDYHFETTIDTVFYSELNSLITNSMYWIPYDTSMYTYDTLISESANYCNTLIVGYDYTTQYFEGEQFIREFGSGIGRVYDYYSYFPFSMMEYSLLYYNKNGYQCGNPDTTGVGITEQIENNTKIIIYPIPAYEKVEIRSQTGDNIQRVELYSLQGEMLLSEQVLKNSYTLFRNNLSTGTYILKCYMVDHSWQSKKVNFR